MNKKNKARNKLELTIIEIVEDIKRESLNDTEASKELTELENVLHILTDNVRTGVYYKKS